MICMLLCMAKHLQYSIEILDNSLGCLPLGLWFVVPKTLQAGLLVLGYPFPPPIIR